MRWNLKENEVKTGYICVFEGGENCIMSELSLLPKVQRCNRYIVWTVQQTRGSKLWPLTKTRKPEILRMYNSRPGIKLGTCATWSILVQSQLCPLLVQWPQCWLKVSWTCHKYCTFATCWESATQTRVAWCCSVKTETQRTGQCSGGRTKVGGHFRGGAFWVGEGWTVWVGLGRWQDRWSRCPSYPNPLPACLLLYWTSQICSSNIAGRDPINPILKAVALPRARGKISPYSKDTSSHHLSCTECSCTSTVGLTWLVYCVKITSS